MLAECQRFNKGQKLGPERSLVTSSDAKMSMDSVELPLSPYLTGSKGELSSMNPSEMGIRHRDGIGQILMQL